MALSHARSGEVVNLQAQGAQSSGMKTAALVKRDRFEAVRLIVPGGTAIPAHKVAGYFTLYCLEGHIVLEADQEIEMRQGDWMYLERGLTHGIRAIADSALLLTIMFD